MSNNSPFLYIPQAPRKLETTKKTLNNGRINKSALTSALAATFLFTLLLPLPAAAITSTIQITSSPFLSFITVPDSFRITVDAPTSPQAVTYTSDLSTGALQPERYIEVQDTRACGGFNLQMEASAFLPAPTPPNTSLNENFRVITSVYDPAEGIEENGIKYFGFDPNPYAGATGVIAPLNTTSTDFADASIFTSAPFNTGMNILTANTPVDVMQGSLTAPNGRDGIVHTSMSFHLIIPKFTAPNDYYSTLTYTLTDATTGTCT